MIAGLSDPILNKRFLFDLCYNAPFVYVGMGSKPASPLALPRRTTAAPLLIGLERQ